MEEFNVRSACDGCRLSTGSRDLSTHECAKGCPKVYQTYEVKKNGRS